MIIADGTDYPTETHSEENNYMKKIRRMQADGRLPLDTTGIRIAVLHDWDCPALSRKRGICECDAEIKVYYSN
jgi:hypothetical protein